MRGLWGLKDADAFSSDLSSRCKRAFAPDILPIAISSCPAATPSAVRAAGHPLRTHESHPRSPFRSHLRHYIFRTNTAYIHHKYMYTIYIHVHNEFRGLRFSRYQRRWFTKLCHRIQELPLLQLGLGSYPRCNGRACSTPVKPHKFSCWPEHDDPTGRHGETKPPPPQARSALRHKFIPSTLVLDQLVFLHNPSFQFLYSPHRNSFVPPETP